jgi:hypothetical protein
VYFSQSHATRLADGVCGSEANGAEFLELLAKPPHELTADEKPFVHVISGGAGHPDYLNIRYARTEIIQGKTVIIVNGVWKSNFKESGFHSHK